MNLEARCNAIEECYEFMLAYAAQGLADDAGTQSGSQIREFLRRAVAAVTGIGAGRWLGLGDSYGHPRIGTPGAAGGFVGLRDARAVRARGGPR